MNQRSSLPALALILLAACGGDASRRTQTGVVPNGGQLQEAPPPQSPASSPSQEPAGAEGGATAYVDLVLVSDALPRTVQLTVKIGETLRAHELVKTGGSCLMPGDEKQRRAGAPLDDLSGKDSRPGYLVSFVCTEGNQRSTHRLYSTPAGIDVVSATQQTKAEKSGPIAIGTPNWGEPRSFGVPADVGIVYGWADSAR